MKVTICGPNLNDQSRGTFHVHAEGCKDLKKYGPGRQFGGDEKGEDEMTIEASDIHDVCVAIYSDHISEQPPAERLEYINNLYSDFYFAACCEAELWGSEREGHGPEHFNAHNGDHSPPPDETDANEVDPSLVIEQPPESHDVYECWVSDGETNFAKLKSDDRFGVTEWVMSALRQLPMHGHIHIVKHRSDEYFVDPDHQPGR